MKYLCLGYHDEGAWRAMASPARAALIEESRAYDEALRQTGHLDDGDAKTTTTLRFANGRVSVAEGPPPGANGRPPAHVRVIEAADLNHAIQLMSHLPSMLPGGVMEIRPMCNEPNGSDQ